MCENKEAYKSHKNRNNTTSVEEGEKEEIQERVAEGGCM